MQVLVKCDSQWAKFPLGDFRLGVVGVSAILNRWLTNQELKATMAFTTSSIGGIRLRSVVGRGYALMGASFVWSDCEMFDSQVSLLSSAILNRWLTNQELKATMAFTTVINRGNPASLCRRAGLRPYGCI